MKVPGRGRWPQAPLGSAALLQARLVESSLALRSCGPGGQVCGAHLGSGGRGEPLTEAQLLPASSRLSRLAVWMPGSCSPGVALGPQSLLAGGGTGAHRMAVLRVCVSSGCAWGRAQGSSLRPDCLPRPVCPSAGTQDTAESRALGSGLQGGGRSVLPVAGLPSPRPPVSWPRLPAQPLSGMRARLSSSGQQKGPSPGPVANLMPPTRCLQPHQGKALQPAGSG